jgi:hypothetical protein
MRSGQVYRLIVVQKKPVRFLLTKGRNMHISGRCVANGLLRPLAELLGRTVEKGIRQ